MYICSVAHIVSVDQCVAHVSTKVHTNRVSLRSNVPLRGCMLHMSRDHTQHVCLMQGLVFGVGTDKGVLKLFDVRSYAQGPFDAFTVRHPSDMHLVCPPALLM